jgi:hypothetical protein
MPGIETETEVRIYDDHRDNLTVDIENDLVRERAAILRSEHSEAALLWNVFRALQKLDVAAWLPRLVRGAIPDAVRQGTLVGLFGRASLARAEFHWWKRYDLPESRHTWLREAALNGCLRLDHYVQRSIPEKRSEVQRRLAAQLPLEDPVEIPLCIETSECLIGVDAVYKGNLRRFTPFDAHRDAVLRLLDAGSHAAAQAGKRFLAIIVCTDPRVLNVETRLLVERYRDRPERLCEALPHRDDRAVVEAAAHELGLVRWRDVGTLLLETKDAERLGVFDGAVLDEIVKYLGRKDVGFNFFRRLK